MEQLVKVFIAIADPIKVALKQVISLFGLVTFTENVDEADLVIIDSARGIANTYRADKWYAIFSTKDEGGKHSPNVRHISIHNFIPPFVEYVQEIQKHVRSETKTLVPETVTEFLPDAKTILVIEDTPRHQASAKSLLAGHQLTVAKGYEEAMELMSKNRYEVVLSDLYLPMSAETLSNEAFELGKLVPYGLLLALEAARQGAEAIAVATDLNHHADAIAAAFDHYSRHPYTVNGSIVRFLHAPMIKINGEWTKDWKCILESFNEK